MINKQVGYKIYRKTGAGSYYSRGVVNITFNKHGKIFDRLELVEKFMNKPRFRNSPKDYEIHKVEIITSKLAKELR